MLQRTTSTLFVSALFAMTASAQTNPFGNPSLSTSSPDLLLADWQADHGDSWHMATNPATGTLEMLYGGNAQSPFEPNTNVPSDWFALGRHWINQTKAMHMVDGAELVEERFRYLPLGQGNTTDKITVRFNQVVGGVPVEDGAINVLFSTQGRLLSIHTTAAPEVEDQGARPTIGAGFANLAAAQAFEAEFGVEPTVQGSERLVHAQMNTGETRSWALAWQVEAMSEVDGAQPVGRLYTIDGHTGQVLKSVDTIHNFDVRGTISSRATPGLTAPRAANPAVPLTMPRVRVQSSAGTVETDRNGDFNFVGVNTPLDLTVDYFGEFTNINNDAGPDFSITFQNVQPNVQNDLLMNDPSSIGVTAQANVQLHINVLRDFIVDRFPTDDTADFRAVGNVNLAQSCNAFFNGNSVNFFSSGGGCNNTAFSTVVAHEMGHWLNVLYGTGNGDDGIGEGNADVFALYVYDDPIVGAFFTTGGGAIRNGNNNRQFCGDANPGCHGGVHANGEVWMGAAWKIRTNLNNSLGNALGDMTADNLFLGWMNSFNQTTIRSIIETQWLTLDDDDGNIDNGTPNYNAIDAGFRQQGFPGFDLAFVSFANVTELPNVTTASANYDVDADIILNLGTNLSSAELFSRSGTAGPFVSTAMANVGGSTFRGQIAGNLNPVTVEYYVLGTDDQGNSATFPAEGADAPLFFRVGELTSPVATNFENGAAGFTVGSPDDDATTGIWTLGNPIGTAAQPEDDNSSPGVNCFFTGQGAPGGGLGANDVDGGQTSLLSPIFDADGAAALGLSYARWYSNDQGGAPNADVFLAQVSNNGGASWVTAETTGPDGPETQGGWIEVNVELSDFIALTSNMRVRFVAADLGTGSIVEAGVDDVEIVVLSDGGAPTSNYCISGANSTGFPGTISSAGSVSVAMNDFALISSNLPANSFGIYFFGPDQTQQPLANSQGTLCVAGSILRLPAVQADNIGGAFYSFDFTGSSNENQIQGGTTLNFQLWYRDAVSGTATSNTTDGLTVQFQN